MGKIMVQDRPSTCDVAIIGGGIAGASVGAFLAEAGLRVVVLEREDQPGYHSTGRSAALFSETYGPPVIRKLSTASRPFLEAPPEGFAEHPLLSPRGMMLLATPGGEEKLGAFATEATANGARLQHLDPVAMRAVVPVLQAGVFSAAMYEPDAQDLDVHALHHGFLRRLRRFGGAVETRAEIAHLVRQGGVWRLTCRDGSTLEAPVVVNAAGGWGDVIAEAAGVRPVGLTPKRRTMVTIPLGDDLDARHWPLTGDIGETFYIKPEVGRLLLSPADATPVPPQDVQPEELDVALAIDRLMQVTTLTVERPGESWAGLRTFAPDGSPVAGFAPDAEGFFWLVGQGGYGIQTAAALGRLAAALVRGADVPEDMARLGLRAADLAPDRATLQPAGA